MPDTDKNTAWDDIWVFNDEDTGDDRCAWCGGGEPAGGWVERAPGFRLCSQDCADRY
jgi:hypothetical protein